MNAENADGKTVEQAKGETGKGERGDAGKLARCYHSSSK